MSYLERLKTGKLLFAQIILEENNEQQRQQLGKSKYLEEQYGKYLYNPENLPRSAWDKKILRLTSINRRLNFLKMFGSPALLSDLNEPFIDRQSEKGRLTVLEASEAKRALRKGVINFSVADGLIGAGMHWGGEKYLHYQFLYDWSYQTMPPELAATFNVWFFFANAGAVPYVMSRSVMEIKRINKERKLTKRDVIIQAAAVGSNLLPVISALSTPLLNLNRAEGFFGALIKDEWAKIAKPLQKIKTFSS